MTEEVTPIVYVSRSGRSGRSFALFANSHLRTELALCRGGARFNMLAVLSQNVRSHRTAIEFEDPQQGTFGNLVIRGHGTEIWFNDEIFTPSLTAFDPGSLVPLPAVRRAFGLAEHPDGRLLYVNFSKYDPDFESYQLHVGGEETMRRVELKQRPWRDTDGFHLDAAVGHLVWPFARGVLPTLNGASLAVRKWYDVVQPPDGQVVISLYS